jgi:hypothetical protein
MGAISSFKFAIGLQDNTGSGTRTIVSNLNRIASALDVTHLAATKTFSIDTSVRKLAIQMGDGAAAVSGYERKILELAGSTGLVVDKAGELISAFLSTGRAISPHIEQMAKLNKYFGMTGAQLVELEAGIDNIGSTWDGLTDAVTKFQDQYNIPGLLNQLPKAVAFAQKSIANFTMSTVGNTERLIAATIKTGAVYAKTFGVDVGKAFDMASQQQESFMSTSRHDQDVLLGLEDSLSGLTTALMEGMVPWEQTQQLMKLGRDDPIKYAQAVLKIRDSLAQTMSPEYAERWLRNVSKNSDEATKQLLNTDWALKKAISTRDKAAVERADTEGFDALASSLGEIGGVVLETIHNLTHLGKTIIGLTFVDDFAETFQGVVPLIKNFNTWLLTTATTIKSHPIFLQMKPVLVDIGRVLITVGAAAGVLASSLAATIIPANTFLSILKALPVAGNAVSLVERMASGLAAFVKETASSVGILSGIAIALNDFGIALKDPSLGSTEIILAGFRAMAIGITEVFDGLLGGIPTWIAKKFFPRMQGSLGDVVRRLFARLQMQLAEGSGKAVSYWWDKFKSTFIEKWLEFAAYMELDFNSLQKKAAEWGQNIGRAIGTLAKWASDAIAPLFSADTWVGWFNQVRSFIRGEGETQFVGPFWDLAIKAGKVIKTFTTNLIDKALQPFGLGFIEVKDKFYEFWDVLRTAFAWFELKGWPKMQAGWLQLKIGVVEFSESALEGIIAFKNGSLTAWDYMKGSAMAALGAIGVGLDLAIAGYHGLKMATLGAAWAASLLTGPLDPGGFRKSIEDSMSATTKAMEANAKSIDKWSDMGSTGLSTLWMAGTQSDQRNKEEEARSKKARSENKAMLAPSRARLDELVAGEVGNDTAFDDFVEGVGRNAEQRGEQRDAAISARSGRRTKDYTDEAVNAFQSRDLRDRLGGETQKVLETLGELAKQATTPEAKNAYELLTNRIDDQMTLMQRTDDPAAIQAAWGAVRSDLDRANLTEKVDKGAANLSIDTAAKASPLPQNTQIVFPPELIAAIRKDIKVLIDIAPGAANGLQIMLDQNAARAASLGIPGTPP